jgi:hypothetical protein
LKREEKREKEEDKEEEEEEEEAKEEEAEEKEEQEEEVLARKNYLRAARVLKRHEAEAAVPSGILSVRRNESIGYSPIPTAPKFVNKCEAGI